VTGRQWAVGRADRPSSVNLTPLPPLHRYAMERGRYLVAKIDHRWGAVSNNPVSEREPVSPRHASRETARTRHSRIAPSPERPMERGSGGEDLQHGSPRKLPSADH